MRKSNYSKEFRESTIKSFKNNENTIKIRDLKKLIGYAEMVSPF
ncbi:hypothetical protein [Aliarcobacter cryaerophilus]|nr:hypothetical protein [Aliarcobacter cryaerophilus]